jgi:hypothetical protein
MTPTYRARKNVMKRNKERKQIWNSLKAAVVIGMAGALLIPGSASVANGKRATFTIENPPVDFEVIDAEPFDGFGDNGPYSTFNDALLGTVGEARSMAEFDISSFSVPPGEYIRAATFEVEITEIDIFGLGVDGETPESLAVDGYVGNGLDELSDFEAGDGNVLESVAIPDPRIGQVLSFRVTSFVSHLVNTQEQYVGLTIRAETFGGLWVTEGGVFPKLTIETGILGDTDGDGDVDVNDFLELLAAWGPCADCDYCPADFNGDCSVDVLDFLILLANWG